MAQSAEKLARQNWVSSLFEVELRALPFSKNAFVVESLQDLYQNVEQDQLRYPILHKGYFDSHLHATWMGLRSEDLELSHFRSFDELRESVLARIDRGDECVRAFGWDESHYQMTLEGFVQKLEQALPQKIPIALYRVCGHSAWANLELRKQMKMPQSPPLFTDRLLEKVNDFFAPPTIEQCERAFLESQQTLLNHGVTSIGEMSVDSTMIEALKNLCVQGQLLIDVQACFDAGRGGTLEQTGPLEMQNSACLGPLDRPARLSVKHWKKYLDGSFGSRTAWLKDSYQDEESFGESLVNISTLLNQAKEALDRGFYLSFHCIGDAALDQALEVGDRLFELCRDRIATDRKLHSQPSSHRLEHTQLIRSDQLERMERQQLWTLCVQPGHRLADAAFIESRLGKKRALTDAYRAASFRDFGISFALSTDAPIDILDPEHVIKSVMNHPTPSEQLSFSEAVWHYTTGSRLSLGLDPNTIQNGSTVFATDPASFS